MSDPPFRVQLSYALPFSTRLLAEIMYYAIVQKEGLGFDTCIEEAKSRMARYNVAPNML